MKQLTIVLAVALFVLGGAGYLLSGMVSPTALIPCGFAFVLLALARFGNPDKSRGLAIAVFVIALLGAAGSASGLAKLPELFDGSAARPAATVSRSLMFVLCTSFCLWCLWRWVQLTRSSEASPANR